MSTSPSDDRPPISRNLVILAITLAIGALFISMVRSFLIALFLAAIFSAIAYPLFSWIATKLGARRKVGAVLTLLLLTSTILLPGIVLLILVTEQAREVGAHAVPWIEHQLPNTERADT